MGLQYISRSSIPSLTCGPIPTCGDIHIVYVDDIILTGNNEVKIKELKKVVTKEFEIKDLSPVRYFLRMEVAQSSKDIAISQRKYTLDLLKEVGMLGCKPGDVLTDVNHKIGPSKKGKAFDKECYQRLVGHQSIWKQ